MVETYWTRQLAEHLRLMEDWDAQLDAERQARAALTSKEGEDE